MVYFLNFPNDDLQHLMPHQLLARTFEGILERTGLAADQVFLSSPDDNDHDYDDNSNERG